MIQVYRDIYTLTGYGTGVLLGYYRTKIQKAVLPPCPFPRSGTSVSKNQSVVKLVDKSHECPLCQTDARASEVTHLQDSNASCYTLWC